MCYDANTINLLPMELTQEYFDQVIKGLVTKEDAKNFATKDDLTILATKADLKAQTKELEEYTNDVAATILEAVDAGFNRVNRRLDGRDKRLEKVEGELSEMKGALHLT